MLIRRPFASRAAVLRVFTCWLISLVVWIGASAAEAGRRSFDLPSDTAEQTLKLFSGQSGHGLLVSTEISRGVKTNAVKGELTPGEALDKMLAGTGLAYSQDEKSGAFVVRRENNDPNAPRAEQVATTDRPSPNAKTEAALQLEAFVVTGSNLRAGESTGGANLRVVTTVEVEQAGTASLATFLKKIPEAGANGFAENRVNTSSPGTAAVSLRGLGANSTLVLLNGRRVTAAPFAQGGSAASLGTIQFVDLNMIPIDAIARVEVLKDGASAVYGADAVAGVVNLILKDNVQGSTLHAYYGDFPGSIAANTFKASVYAGVKEGKFKLFVLANYLHQASIQYGELSPRLVALSNGSNPGTFVVPVGAINPITGAVIPAGTAAAARTFTVESSATGYPPTFNTTPATATQNRYNINEALNPQPRVTRQGALATFGYQVSRTVDAYAELNFQQNKNLEFLSPSPITNLNTVTLPANATYNPFGVTVTNSPAAGATLIYRFAEAGPRATETTNEFTRLVTGLKGSLGTAWTWDVSALYNRSTAHNDLVSGWLSQAAVNAALADPDKATALNLFTNGTTIFNNPTTLAKIASHGTRDAFTELTSLGGKTTGILYELPAGNLNLASGAEWREERFRDHRTQDQLLNQSTPVPQSKGTRRVEAVYAELSVPLTSSTQKIPGLATLELNAAGRAEHYSDAGFKNTTVPRLGLRWQPIDAQITLRSTWGKGYRVPSLAELYQPQSTSIVFNVADPLRAGKPGSNANDTNTGAREIISGGNPNLSPEKSESWNYGILFQPKILSGLSLSIDYYKVHVDDRIGQPATAAIILANPTLFPGFAERAAPTASDTANGLPGELIRIRTVTGNYGTAETSGLDVSAEYRFSTARYGKFTVRAAASTIYHEIIRSRPDLAAVDTVGTYEFPRLRGNGSLAWSFHKFGSVVTVDYIDGFADAAPSVLRVKQQVITGLQLSYDLPAATKITLGVNNLFDRDPPRTAATTGYAEQTSYFLPRFVYLDITKKF